MSLRRCRKFHDLKGVLLLLVAKQKVCRLPSTERQNATVPGSNPTKNTCLHAGGGGGRLDPGQLQPTNSRQGDQDITETQRSRGQQVTGAHERYSVTRPTGNWSP